MNPSQPEPVSVGASLLANRPSSDATPFASKDWGVPLAPTKSVALEALS